jgi:hypothetical protein
MRLDNSEGKDMTDDRKQQRASDWEEAAEQRASTSMEFPADVTRSTQDLTIGGSEKDPESHTEVSASAQQRPSTSATKEGTPVPSPKPTGRREKQSTRPLSDSEQALENQERALESGEESPG